MKAGRSNKTVSIFLPMSNELINKITGPLNEKSEETNNNNGNKIIASGEGREITRAVYQGDVTVNFQVTMRDIEKLGYKLQ